MSKPLQIGLIGDRDPSVLAHRAIPMALQLAANAFGLEINSTWLATDSLGSTERLSRFDGLWCTPGSPYRSMAGALRAIRFAREGGLPFLGTCGGFQHAVVEYARHVLGWADADHAETAPDAELWVIEPLACSLLEASGSVRFFEGSHLAAAYGRREASESYHCRYGINPDLQDKLLAGSLRATADDEDSEVRGIELSDHPFFVATLFQPERAALHGRLPPLVSAFVRAVHATSSLRAAELSLR